MKKKILVLGGGPCGLSAAWELSKYGYDVTVIEKEAKVGGLCITNEYKGYRFDSWRSPFHIQKQRTC